MRVFNSFRLYDISNYAVKVIFIYSLLLLLFALLVLPLLLLSLSLLERLLEFLQQFLLDQVGSLKPADCLVHLDALQKLSHGYITTNRYNHRR